MIHGETIGDEHDEAEEYGHLLEANPYFKPQNPKVERLQLDSTCINSKENKAPQVELKPLPSLLRYEFLRPDSTYPIIVNANLTKVEIEKLLRELRLHQKVIGYTTNDMKEIYPPICMHRILLKNGHKASIEHQRRLNPNMKGVFEKECLNCLMSG